MPLSAILPLAISAAGSVAKHIGAKRQAGQAAKTDTANMAARWNPSAQASAARNSLIKGIMSGYGISESIDPALMSKLTTPAAAPTSAIQGPSTLGMLGGGLQDFSQLAAAGGFGQPKVGMPAGGPPGMTGFIPPEQMQ